MKKLYIVIGVLCLVALQSCHKPEYIEPTAERQGLTSLTAIFTFGPYVNQEMARLSISDDTQERYVIPVPFYFPETSDDETTPYMIKVRVQAELQPNYTISPPLTLLDLTEENWFTYTDPHGVSRNICITGERVKSSACEVISFSLDSPAVGGVVDKAAHHVLLPTKDDVTASTATVQVSAHATISPDPKQPRDYSKPVKFTVTADDGHTTAEYLVEVGDPEKLESGIDANSVERLFNFDPVSRLGLPAYNQACYPSLAVSSGRLIFCYGNGTAPMVLNGKDGTKVGTMKLGSAKADVITSDEAEHILIANYAEGGESAGTVNVYVSDGPSDTPVLLCSFTNPSICPIGHRMKVIGNVKSDAIITFTAEGIDGVTESSDAVYVTIKDGAMDSVNMTSFDGLGYGGWGSAPVNVATVVPVSLNPQDGWLVDWYGSNADADGNYLLHYVNGSGSDTIIARLGDWASNVNCLDTKQFNSCRYAAVFSVSHFPCWGISPGIYFYEINDPSSPSLMFSNSAIGWYQQGDYCYAAGDVVLAPSADGYYLYLYYYDQNSQAIGGYVVDCIKR